MHQLPGVKLELVKEIKRYQVDMQQSSANRYLLIHCHGLCTSYRPGDVRLEYINRLRDTNLVPRVFVSLDQRSANESS